jgi:phosphate uptake regulator
MYKYIYKIIKFIYGLLLPMGMKRKIVKQGQATLMISLPTKWCQNANIKKGDEVNLEVINDRVVVSSEKINTKKETIINLKGLTESAIRTFLTNTYRLGYDKIRVNLSNPQQYIMVQTVVKKDLIGFDIIKREKEYCIIENITEPSGEQFENIIQKIFYNISELFNITEERLKGKKPLTEYTEIEERIKQYDNFCRRVIIKQNVSNKSELLWSFLTLIVHGQREIYHLNKYLDKNKVTGVSDTLKDARNVFEHVMDAYLKKSVDLLEEVHEFEKKAIYDRAYKVMVNKKGHSVVVEYHVASSLRTFYLASSPLIGILLN